MLSTVVRAADVVCVTEWHERVFRGVQESFRQGTRQSFEHRLIAEFVPGGWPVVHPGSTAHATSVPDTP
eukprot:2189983-Rhodomonas_salina.2